MRFLASHSQRRILFFEQRNPGSPAHNVPRLFDLSGDLNVDMLRDAFAEVIARHQSLRVRFEQVDGETWAIVLPRQQCEIIRLADGLTSIESERELARYARMPFDTERGPLFRICAMKAGRNLWRILLVLHHTCVDDIGVRAVVRDWAAAYEHLRIRGDMSPVSGRLKGYDAFAAWEREFASSTAGRSAIAALAADMLSVEPAAIESGGARFVDDGEDGRISLQVPEATVQSMEALARIHRCTPFMVVCTAFSVLLSRYTGEADLLFGVAIGNRRLREMGEHVGDFVNTVPLRVQVESGTFLNCLSRTRKALLRCLQLGAAPIDLVVQAAERSGRGDPFRVLLLENLEMPALTLAEVGCTTSRPWTGAAKVDLQVSIEKTGAGRTLYVEFRSGRICADMAQRLAGHLVAILSAGAAAPYDDVAVLGLLSEDERNWVLSLSRGEVVAQASSPVHNAILEYCRNRPDDVAIVTNEDGFDCSFSYGALELWSRRIAAQVVRHGAVGDRVGVFCHRSRGLSAGLLGVLRAGRIYFPLDPDHPDERLFSMLEEATPAVVLAGRDLVERSCLRRFPVVCIEDVTSQESSDEAVDVAVDPMAPAYLLYTSGSTGRPKGALNTHLGLSNRLEWMQAAYPISSGDVVLHKTPISFDVSVWELIWPLMRGARMTMAKPDGHRDPAYLRDLIERDRVTVAHFVPSMLRLFLHEVGADRCGSLRHLICSGEALANDLVDAWLARPTGAIHNLYGPTEAAIDVTSWTCQRHGHGTFAPIGKPIHNTGIFVLDAQQCLVPVGAAGELYIGGSNVALGYLNRPDLTAERFLLVSLYRGYAPVRLYRTGDLGRLRDDGSFEFLGRTDEQIKLNGVRVELGEIEALLRQHPAVADAAVVLQHDGDSESSLIAYIVGTDDGARLEEWLLDRLPAAMTPRVYCRIEALPRTHSGKINRKTLPRIDRTMVLSGVNHAVPRSHREQAIADIWRDVLRHDRVGIDDDFFAIGGDSLRSLRVAARMRAIGFAVSVTDILAATTIRSLARRVSETVSTASERLTSSTEFPDPRLVQALWLNSQTSPTYRAYLTSFCIRTKWDEAAMRRVLQSATDRHLMLRASLVSDGGAHTFIRANTDVDVELEVYCIDNLSPAHQDEALSVWFDAESRRNWNWDRRLSCRFAVHRRSSNTIQFTIIEPWLDGWSVKTLAEEVLQDYGSELEGLPSRVATVLQPSYADLAYAEHAALESLDHRAFWAERLANMSALLVADGRVASEIVRVEVPLGPLSLHARGIASANGVPLKHLLMAAHMAVVSAITGRSQVVSGVIFNGRGEVVGADKVLGLYLNALPISANLGARTWLEVAQWCLDEEIAITRWRHFPSDELRQMFGQPIFDVLFNFTDFSDMPTALGTAVFVIDRVAFDQTYMALCAQFGAELSSGAITLSLEGDARLFERVGSKRLAALYARALGALCATPKAFVDEWEVASDDGPFLTEWGGGGPSVSVQSSVVELFLDQCARVGDNVCVIDGERAFSFRETRSEVERLAGALHALGVRSGDVVGVCLPRSFEAIVAILAIIRLGAAFAPLPTDAAERRAFIIADAGLQAVVSRRTVFGASECARWLDIDAMEPAEPAPEFRRPQPDAALHILYTSGSTGRPKGVETSERAVLNRLWWMWRLEPFSSDEVMAQKTPLAFVDSVWEILGGILAGCTTFVVSDECSRDALALCRALKKGACTRLTLVPSMADAMLHDVSTIADSLRRVRVLILSGEPLTENTAERLLVALPNAKMFNLYGSTETAGDATFRQVVCAAGAGLVGRPIAGSRVVVTDDSGRLSPIGVPGEIRVVGACLATRYVGWAERNPGEQGRWKSTPWGVAWSTGDLGFWRRDGTLAVLGRRDRQLKVRGVRIEPGEIESVLLSVPGVRRALATLAPSGALTAFIEAEGVTLDRLRQSLTEALPNVMTPTRMIIVERFPQTLTGKIDTAKLIELSDSGIGLDADEQPITEQEILLAGVLREVFPGREIVRSSNFFDLGGHSLLAGAVVSRLRQRLRVHVPMRLVFEHPVLADLALALERNQAENSELT